MEERKCPRCHADLAEDTPYCWNCGFQLGNYCDNPECVVDEYTDPERMIVDLPPHFTYCPYCGSQTHYAKLGFAKQLVFE